MKPLHVCSIGVIAHTIGSDRRSLRREGRITDRKALTGYVTKLTPASIDARLSTDLPSPIVSGTLV
jgi:hypothetical protein